MASGEGVLRYILDQLSDVEGITYRPMMGEYLLYVRGRLLGGVYDNRLLVKPVPAALACVEKAGKAVQYENPYEGAKELLLIEDVDDHVFLCGLAEAMYEELPVPKGTASRKVKKGKS
ncbi:MAG: TfoX/Sxy family protein [Oscillibacter sp.]|nr:TfoX/Sxy family protein [Oscillibacter sp.]